MLYFAFTFVDVRDFLRKPKHSGLGEDEYV
jgi:hypothetical protein